MSNVNFSDKTAIVTGGARGIGASIAKSFARAGANVAIVDILDELGESLSRQMKEEGKSVHFIHCDICDPWQVKQMAKTAKEHFGSIDILINNAGISFSRPVFELSVEEWDKVINTNLRGAFLCAREAAALMKKGGKIINIASTRAFMSEPGWESYGASKGGLVALTHALAISLGPYNIQVNSISPGWIMTGNPETLRLEDHQQHPSGRVGNPEDIARACLFLADPENSFITGQNLVIDGGMTRKMIYLE